MITLFASVTMAPLQRLFRRLYPTAFWRCTAKLERMAWERIRAPLCVTQQAITQRRIGICLCIFVWYLSCFFLASNGYHLLVCKMIVGPLANTQAGDTSSTMT